MHKLAYRPGSSVIYRLYPLTKLVWLLLGSVVIFILSDSFLLLSIACIYLLMLNIIYPLIWRVRGFLFAFLTGAFLFMLYLVFEKSGQIIFHLPFSWMDITSGGIEIGLRYTSRFLAIIFLSYLFILTTEPSKLSYALMRIGIPYRVTFMLVTALRLAPLLEDEGKTIYKAQLVRGVRYDNRNVKKIFLLVQQFMTPLLISAIRRVDKLVFSMEGRGFGKYSERTFRSQISPTWIDLSALIVMLAYFSILVMINYGVIK